VRRNLDDILLGELHPFRRITRSVWEMAFLAGVIGRVLHTVFSAPSDPLGGDQLSWWSFAGRFLLIPVLVLGMAAVHLSNYAVREWAWRAPVFAMVEAMTAAFVSLALIFMGRARLGTGRAELSDWPLIAGGILLWHVLAICAFCALLGGVVQWIRKREAALGVTISDDEGEEETPERPSPGSKPDPEG